MISTSMVFLSLTRRVLRGSLSSLTLWYCVLLLSVTLLVPSPRVLWISFLGALVAVAWEGFAPILFAALEAEVSLLEARARLREKLAEPLSDYEAKICADIVATQNKWSREEGSR